MSTFLTVGRGVGRPPLVAAGHPSCHHAAPCAGLGQHMHGPARRGHVLGGQPVKVGNQNDESLKIARPS
jgi:hypothetical protein